MPFDLSPVETSPIDKLIAELRGPEGLMAAFDSAIALARAEGR